MNRLQYEKSPYLLQHAGNPVDWYPWGAEAFRKAEEEDRPIFLSIGYSTCHWCHVMERECFEDGEVAALMNGAFVCVKVDREERPDLDAEYMDFCQRWTGSGGWPLTIVMTPDRRPFFAGTYIPRTDSFGRLGMLRLVPRIAEFWRTRRGDLPGAVAPMPPQEAEAPPRGAGGTPGAKAVSQAAGRLLALSDRVHGGFGGAPKFPMPLLFPLLLRAWRRGGDGKALEAAVDALTAMRCGGIYDQIGFGFHRYSTDSRWLVPHFEKMLYDQALLAVAYTEAWQATGLEVLRRTALEIFEYVRRDLAAPEGGFCSAEDADSGGVEGRFYLWTAAGARSALGEDRYAAFAARYRISGEGNYRLPGEEARGENILHRSPGDHDAPGAPEESLRRAREGRERPFRDDKVLCDWNGLLVAALARTGAVFDDPDLVRSAAQTADFLLRRLRGTDGGLLHRYRDGEAAIDAFADDYAFLIWGLLELYDAGFDAARLEEAVELMELFLARHWDPVEGGFFLTAHRAETGPGGRRKPLADSALPSANSVAAQDLLRLAALTGNGEYARKAGEILRLYPPDAGGNPLAYASFLAALDRSVGPAFEVVLAADDDGKGAAEMIRALRRSFLPNVSVLLRPPGPEPGIARVAPFTLHQTARGGKATAYVCQRGACGLPVQDPADLLARLRQPPA